MQWLKAAVDAELQTPKVGSAEIDDVLTKQQPCELSFNNHFRSARYKKKSVCWESIWQSDRAVFRQLLWH